MNVLLDQSEIAHVANLIRYARSQQKRRGFFRLYLPDREEIDLIVSAGAKVHSYSRENNSEMYRLELELGNCIFSYAQAIPFLGDIKGH